MPRSSAASALLFVLFLVPSGHAQEFSFTFSGPPGEYISGGQSYAYTPQNARLGVQTSDAVSFNVSSLSTSQAQDWWTLSFKPYPGTRLEPGLYAGAARYPFEYRQPGLSLYGNGRGCNTLTGNFAIYSSTYLDGQLVGVDATFEQRCEGGGPPLIGEITLEGPLRPASARPLRGDYTGNGRGDVAVFRPSTAQWLFARGGSSVWGAVNDTPVPADYDGDKKIDLATYRAESGAWTVRRSTDGGTATASLGSSLDTPAPGDYDGDGKADVAVFRKSTGMWMILQSSNGVTRYVQWGGSGGDVPVPADYDGDGMADVAIFSQGTGGGGGLWYIITSSNGGTRVVQWGGTGGDIPIPYDFDGDGKDDVAIQSPGDGKWYIIQSSNGATRVAQWGGSGGDQPQPSDFDGDGKADIAIFNPGAGKWYVIHSASGLTRTFTLGQHGDAGVTR